MVPAHHGRHDATGQRISLPNSSTGLRSGLPRCGIDRATDRRIVEDEIGVGTGDEPALAGSETKDIGRVGGDECYCTLQRELAIQRCADEEWRQDVDAGEAGRGPPDVVPPRFLIGGGKGRVVGGDGVDGAVAKSFPEPGHISADFSGGLHLA